MKKGFLVAGIITVMLMVCGIYWLAFDVDRLSDGELISEERSPQGTYTVKAYVMNPAKARPQTIYWNYREEIAEIEWLEENLVRVNGIEIKVPDGHYDFRRQ